MPTTDAGSTSRRLLTLLSLLQVRRDWPGALLAERLQVSVRTLRRDVDRLRELGYCVRAVKGPDGGYRLDAGGSLPPLLFDDEQALALAMALRTAALAGAGVEEAAARALATIRQVLPGRLRGRLDLLEQTVVDRPDRDDRRGPADPAVLLVIAAAVRDRRELRFDYRSPADADRAGGEPETARRVQPHHLLARAGRWYLVAWEPEREDWRIYRADRITPRIPAGPRFTAREVPGGDAAAFVSARFKGSAGSDAWPCQAQVTLRRPAAEVAAFAGDGIVEALDDARCRVRLGSWSWPGLAARVAAFDADVEGVDRPELRRAFADLARRAERAAAGDDPSAGPDGGERTQGS